MTIKREPRIDVAKKTVRPRQPWEAVYESYTPLPEPLPLNIMALYFFGEAQIWALGGDPDVDVLCEVITVTNPGTIEDDVDPNNAWALLCHSLTGLCYGKGVEMREAFQAACAILNDVVATRDSADDARTAAAAVADRLVEETAPDEALEELREKLGIPGDDHPNEEHPPVCIICRQPAEVSWPDGQGDQVHYCGEHEPHDDGDPKPRGVRRLEKSGQLPLDDDTAPRPEGVVRRRL